ncbi:MAG: hypothetical protein QXJ97_07515 [Desulfurococcaceae archaeon]
MRIVALAPGIMRKWEYRMLVCLVRLYPVKKDVELASWSLNPPIYSCALTCCTSTCAFFVDEFALMLLHLLRVVTSMFFS